MNIPQKQTGVTLVELLVGIFLGLLVVGVALGSLLVSRGFTAATVDTSSLQQQAAMAFRVIGQQIRQAGSLRLDMDVSNRDKSISSTIDPLATVGFVVGYNRYPQIIRGKDNPGANEYTLSIGYENYVEQVTTGAPTHTFFRNCLGQGGLVENGGAKVPVLQSHFKHNPDTNALECAGMADNTSAVGAQEIIRNVADFRVAYFVQSGASTGQPQISKETSADQITATNNWPNVVAIEVCLDMVGDVGTDIPATMTYRGCNDQNLPYAGKAHMVYRNVFNIRSQGIFS